MPLAVAKITLACLWETKIPHTFPVLHMTCLSAWVFFEKSQIDLEFFFTLLLTIKSAWYRSLAGCHTIQTKMSSDFLTHCTLAAFILFFSLPSAMYFFPLFFLRKKVFDKGFNTPATLRGPSPQRSPAQTLQCHRKPSRAVWTIRVLVTGPHIVLWYPWGKKKNQSSHITLSGIVFLSQGEDWNMTCQNCNLSNFIL